MAKKTTVKKAVDTPLYSVSLNLAGNTIDGVGDSVFAALRAMKKPVKITTKSVITVTKGVKTHSRPLTIPLAQRLFRPGFQLIQAKNLESCLK